MKRVRNKIKQAEYAKKHYEANKDKVKQAAKLKNELARKRNSDFIKEYLETRHCIDCGEKDIIVLEFDHKDSSDKINNVCLMVKRAVSLDTLKKEIDKCEIRCANCHRRKTAKQFNFYKTK